MTRPLRHPREVRERAVALVEGRADYSSQWNAKESLPNSGRFSPQPAGPQPVAAPTGRLPRPGQ